MRKILTFIFACAFTMFLSTTAYAEDVWAYRTQGDGSDVYVQSETCKKYLDEDAWIYSANLKWVKGKRLMSISKAEFIKIGPKYYKYRISEGEWENISLNDPFMNTLKVIKSYTGE